MSRVGLAAALFFVSGAAHAEPPLSQVTLTSSRAGAVLEANGTGMHWQRLCLAPCTTLVEAGATLRVTGWRITASDEFVPPRFDRPTTLHADAGSKRAHDGGIILMGLGFIAGAVGAGFLASRDDRLRAPGWTIGGVGIGGFAFGALLFLTSRTHVLDEHGFEL